MNICKKRLLLIPMAFILLFSMVGIGGCAASTTQEELLAPEVSLTSVNIIYHDAGAALYFQTVMQISNPNEVPVTLTGLSYKYYIEGNYISLGGYPDRVYIPANTEVTATSSANLIKVGTLFIQLANQSETWEGRLDWGASTAAANALLAAIDAGEAEWRFNGQAIFDSELGTETVPFNLLWP